MRQLTGSTGADRASHGARLKPLSASIAALGLVFLMSGHGLALSQLQESPTPAGDEAPDDDIERVPLPAPVEAPGTPEEAAPDEPTDGEAPEEAEPGETEPERDVVRPQTDMDKPLPEIFYDLETLPEPVRRMHRLIVEACKSGDIETLRPLVGTGEGATQLSLGGLEGDPLQFLRELSGDSEGQEILAILLEVLQAGYVHLDAGTPSEMYVWPYFFAIPLDSLDKPQRVELFTLVTAGDYEEMKNFGAYIFYRVGITPEGRWAFFVAGD